MITSQLREAMVDNQIRPADVTRYDILAAFLKTKRECFVPKEAHALAYSEVELQISEDRKMMTPRSLAKLIAMADPKKKEEALLIGAGLGYEAAILSQLVDTVIAVENERALSRAAERALASDGYDNAVVIGGKLQLGEKKSGPYDLIVFAGAVENIPASLFDQLKEGGRIAAIIADGQLRTAKLFFKGASSQTGKSFFNASAPLLPGFSKKLEFSF